MGFGLEVGPIKSKKKNSKYFVLEQATTGGSATLTIYGNITSWPWLESDVSAYNLSQQLADLDADHIDVRINSYGGEVSEGLAIYNALSQNKASVTTYCDGFACSMASVIFMAGDERVMADNGLLMIHRASMGVRGNPEQLRKAADDLAVIDEQSNKAYLKSGIDKDELAGLLDKETWLTAEAALDYGFATSIYDDAGADDWAAVASARGFVMDRVLHKGDGKSIRMELDLDDTKMRKKMDAIEQDDCFARASDVAAGFDRVLAAIAAMRTGEAPGDGVEGLEESEKSIIERFAKTGGQKGGIK